jgi:hypothetical protein
MDLNTNSVSTEDWVRVTQGMNITATTLGQQADSVDTQSTKIPLAVPTPEPQLPLPLKD